MCGICGIVALDDAPVHAWEVQGMVARMRHRGPDDTGQFLERPVGLGFVRLSILDLSAAGHQPMHSADGRYVIVYNGEVYNYPELRRELEARRHRFHSGTDTEVVLAAFAEWGPACLHRLNGMFAFALYDRRARRLTLVRDRFGIKPLYYAQIGSRLAFASDLGPLLSVLPAGAIAVNEQAVFDYLAHERVDHTPETFFQGIVKLPHGSLMEIAPDRTHISRWYRLEEHIGRPFPDAQAYLETLDSAVTLALRSDVPVGVSLSGGLDSSSIVALLVGRHGLDDLQTFSAVYGEGQPGDESRYLHAFAGWLRHMHLTRPSADSLLADLSSFVRAQQEPVPRTGPYAQYKVMELARGRVKVTLDGQGADEVLAGYKSAFGFHYKALLAEGRLVRLLRELRHAAGAPGALTAMTSGLYYALPPALQTRWLRLSRPAISAELFDAYAATSRVPELLLGARDLKGALLDMVENKLEHLLKWGDRNAMWFSIESRVPFLDHRLVERTLALPAERILKDGLSKHILREAMSGLLPETIRLRRDKIGFGTPENAWLRTPGLRDLVHAILASDFFRQHPYIDRAAAMRAYAQHLRGQRQIARQIWKWINLYLWHGCMVAEAGQREAAPTERHGSPGAGAAMPAAAGAELQLGRSGT